MERFLGGDYVTGAGTMVAFSIQYIVHMGLAPQDRRLGTMRCGRGTWGLARSISVLWPRGGTTFGFKAQYYPKDQVHLLLPAFISHLLDS